MKIIRLHIGDFIDEIERYCGEWECNCIEELGEKFKAAHYEASHSDAWFDLKNKGVFVSTIDEVILVNCNSETSDEY